MDILFISRCFPYPLHHGDRLLAYHVVEELHGRGHQLDLIALYLEESDLVDTHRVATIFNHVEVVQERRRTPLDYLKRLPHPFPDSAVQCWTPPMWETIERTLTAKHYDVVHFFGGFQVYEYRKAVRDLPNIIVPYDSYALFMRRAISRPTGGLDWFRLQAASLLAHQYERTIYAAFDRTILVSAKDEEYLHHLSPDLNTRVIPSGVDSQYFKPANSIVRTPTLVFVGNYDYPPNTAAVGMLVNAILPRVKLEIPEARATLVGPNPPPWLTALAGDAVEVTGYVQDVRPYLARAACFVAPLTLGSGMRNKILEAMAMGLPVVSTPIGCEGIAVTDGQDVLLGQSPEELARAAISVLQDRGLWEQIAQGGLQLVRQRYNWHKVGAQYEKLYHEVIAEHHS